MWEDRTNKDGGRWLLTLDKGQRRDGLFDNTWMETVSVCVCVCVCVCVPETLFRKSMEIYNSLLRNNYS